MVFTDSIEMYLHTLTQHGISSEAKKPDNKSNICSRTFLERFQTKLNFTLLLLPALCHCASTVFTKLLYSTINFTSNLFYHILVFLSTKNKPYFPIFWQAICFISLSFLRHLNNSTAGQKKAAPLRRTQTSMSLQKGAASFIAFDFSIFLVVNQLVLIIPAVKLTKLCADFL